MRIRSVSRTLAALFAAALLAGEASPFTGWTSEQVAGMRALGRGRRPGGPAR